LIGSVQYQPLIYLLFFSATMILYFTPTFERRWGHRIEAYSIPIIATIYRLINSNSLPYATVFYLWFFTTLYYFYLQSMTWVLLDKVKQKYFDPFGYSYLFTIKKLK
jgi:hypothetical protein